MNLPKALTCEFIGSAFLLLTVVGSGILGHRLDEGNVAVAVMAVAIATGCVLAALIWSLGSISCQLNPIVTLMSAYRREMAWKHAAPFILAQIAGAIVGTVLANVMFELPLISLSETARTGYGQWVGEFIATFGLIGIITGTARSNPTAIATAVGCYVCGAIWFTSSTCFANPAVTIARIFTDTLTGIRAVDVLPFIASQLVGAAAAITVFDWLFRTPSENAAPDEIIRRLERELSAK
jgi:glycerol uptake facilitator-like aquaporin